MTLPSERDLLDLLEQLCAETGVPGISLSLCRGGDRVSAAWGKMRADQSDAMTPRSRFEVSCIMKFLVAICVLTLSADLNLDLDEPIDYVLPELRGTGGAAITWRHLLSHASGYHGLDITDMRVRWHMNWEQFSERYQAMAKLFSPGSVFNYEHSEHVILGKLLSRRFGRAAYDLVQETVLDALQIVLVPTAAARTSGLLAGNHMQGADGKFSAFEIPHFGPFWRDSIPDLAITPEEICRVAAHLMEAGSTAQASGIVEALRARVVPIPAGLRSTAKCERIPAFFSNGCAVFGDGRLGHNGSGLGQTCGLRFDTDRGIAAAVGVNAWMPYVRDTALDRALLLMCREAVVPHREPETRHVEDFLSDTAPESLCGRYVGSYLGEMAVSACDADILIQPPKGRPAIRICEPARGARVESAHPVSVGFQRVGEEQDLALFLGVHAYKLSRGTAAPAQPLRRMQ